MSKEIFPVNTSKAPAPVGPYNQAIIADGWIYCSGQIALDPSSGKLIGQNNIKEETRQVIRNLKAVLNAAGADINNVVKTNVFLKNLNDFNDVNEIYAEFFKGPSSPARACVEVSALPKNCSVEIDCVAWIGK